MTLIVEDGTGKSNSESLCSVAFADTYHAARGNTLWATMTESEKEQALRRFTEHARGRYQGRWKGVRTSSAQALDFPRYGMEVDGYLLPSNAIPLEVQNAWALGAFKAASGDMDEDLDPVVTKEKIGLLEVEYSPASPQGKRFVAVDRLLAPYLSSSGSSIRLVRA